jgi:hypothetical protein
MDVIGIKVEVKGTVVVVMGIVDVVGRTSTYCVVVVVVVTG